MAFNVRFVLVLAVLTVSVARTSADCTRVSGQVTDELVSDCERALWFDTITGKCAKVDPSQSGIVIAVDDPSECTVFYLIPGTEEVHIPFKDGAVFKSPRFQYGGVTVTDLIYSIQLAEGPNSALLDPLTEDFMTTLTFKFGTSFCMCLLDDGSIGSVVYEDPTNYDFCGDAVRCGTRWRFIPTGDVCGTPPDLENGDIAVECTYEGCNTTYVCDDQYEIEGDAVAQCVDGAWSSRPTCVPGDPCANNPCQNGGTCENLGGVAVCTCTRGVTGTNCETDCNVAIDADCENKVRGKKACNRRKCLYKHGCDPELDEPCGENGQCLETNGALRCICSNNFIGGKCQLDVQQCIANRTAKCETYCNAKVYKKCLNKGKRWRSKWNSKGYRRQHAVCTRKLRRQPSCQTCISKCVARAEKKCNNPRCYSNKPRWSRFSNKKYGWGCVKKNRRYWGFVRWLPRMRC